MAGCKILWRLSGNGYGYSHVGRDSVLRCFSVIFLSFVKTKTPGWKVMQLGIIKLPYKSLSQEHRTARPCPRIQTLTKPWINIHSFCQFAVGSILIDYTSSETQHKGCFKPDKSLNLTNFLHSLVDPIVARSDTDTVDARHTANVVNVIWNKISLKQWQKHPTNTKSTPIFSSPVLEVRDRSHYL